MIIDIDDDVSNNEIDGYLKDFVQRGRGPSKSKRLIKEELKNKMSNLKGKISDTPVPQISIKETKSSSEVMLETKINVKEEDTVTE